MHIAFVLLASVVASVCSKPSICRQTLPFPHPTDCTKFFVCAPWGKQIMSCAPGTHFNPTIRVCDWPRAAGCRKSPTTSTTPSTPTTTSFTTTTILPTTHPATVPEVPTTSPIQISSFKTSPSPPVTTNSTVEPAGTSTLEVNTTLINSTSLPPTSSNISSSPPKTTVTELSPSDSQTSEISDNGTESQSNESYGPSSAETQNPYSETSTPESNSENSTDGEYGSTDGPQEEEVTSIPSDQPPLTPKDVCSKRPNEIFVNSHSEDCKLFITCSTGISYVMPCPAHTPFFDSINNVCTADERVCS